MAASPAISNTRISGKGSENSLVSDLKRMLRDKSMGKYTISLNKLYKFLLTSNENERQLSGKLEATKGLCETEQQKFRTASDEIKEDQSVVETLKHELEECWKTIDEAYNKEERSNATIAKLEKEMLDTRNARPIGHAELQHLFAVNEELMKENERLNAKINASEKKSTTTELELRWEKEKTELSKQVSKTEKLVENWKTKLEIETRKREDLEKETKKLRSTLDTQSAKLKSLDSHTSATRLQKQLAGKSHQLDMLQEELDESRIQIHNLKERCKATDDLMAENEKQASAISERDCENESLRQELEKVKRALEKMENKFNKSTVYEDLNALNAKYTALIGEQMQLQKLFQSKCQESDGANERCEKAQDIVRKLTKELHCLQGQLRTKSQEKELVDQHLGQLIAEIQKHKILIHLLEKSRNVCTDELKCMNDQLLSSRATILDLEHEKIPQIEEMEKTKGANRKLEERVVLLKAELALKQEELRRLNDVLREEKILSDARNIVKIDSGGDAYTELQQKYASLQEVHEKAKAENDDLLAKVESITELSKAKTQSNDVAPQEQNKKHGLEDVCMLGGGEHVVNAISEIYADDSISEDLKTSSAPPSDPEIETLKTQITLLNDILQASRKEIADKSESLKGQFEVIKQLRKCISSTGPDTSETKNMKDKINRQEEQIQFLKGKTRKYERYFREKEVKKSSQKLDSSDEDNSTEPSPPLALFVQGRKMPTKRSDKAQHRGSYLKTKSNQ